MHIGQKSNRAADELSRSSTRGIMCAHLFGRSKNVFKEGDQVTGDSASVAFGPPAPLTASTGEGPVHGRSPSRRNRPPRFLKRPEPGMGHFHPPPCCHGCRKESGDQKLELDVPLSTHDSVWNVRTLVCHNIRDCSYDLTLGVHMLLPAMRPCW